MFKSNLAVAGVTVLAIAANISNVAARDQIRIVGSSTVFPFSTAVAEQFGNTSKFKAPVVESTGSGGGLKLFCAGSGDAYPDITNASRRIKSSEVERCAKNGINDIVEVKFGFDGIVLSNSNKAKQMDLTVKEIFLALAKEVPGPDGKLIENPNKTWSDVNAALPNTMIKVLGPPPTSGTRDAFVELAMEGGCKTFPEIKAMKKMDKAAYKSVCHTIREDGAYVEAGENDNLIVQKLGANPDALGIFGFSFLDQNADSVQGSKVNGVDPEFENISDGSYPISRSLFFYVKRSHVTKVPGIPQFLAEFTSEKAWGPEGYLADKGLIPLPEQERNKWREAANGLAGLSM